MRIEEAGWLLREDIASLRIMLPEGSPLCREAEDVREMVSAYCRDGHAFMAGGDPVNALASFAYALGWMEGGVYLGLFSPAQMRALPSFSEGMPPSMLEHLHEKTLRYNNLLMRAISALECAPEQETCLYSAALHALNVAGTSLQIGRQHISIGDEENALALFSYGFAWLDAGVRTGLFRVLKERDLFTI